MGLWVWVLVFMTAVGSSSLDDLFVGVLIVVRLVVWFIWFLCSDLVRLRLGLFAFWWPAGVAC